MALAVRRLLSCVVGMVFAVSATDAVAQSVTAPSTQTIVAAGADWATRAFQDPIDMDAWTDISWWAYAADQPPVHLTGVTYGACTGGAATCFKATTSATDANVWILETGNPPSARLGKTGDNFPIDANTHRVVAIRMRISSGSCSYVNPPFTCTASFYWDKGSLYDAPPTGTRSNSFFTYDGWQIYLIDLTTLGYSGGTALAPWTGTIGDLRLNLTAIAGVPIEIDWIRLVPNTLTNYTISWTGISAADVYLDNNTNKADGNLGLIVKNGVNSTLAARNVTGGSYTFQPGALAPGDYYAEVCPAGANPTTGSCVYSPGYFRVNAVPTMEFTSPSPEGSADDFATVQLNQPWDMTATSQVDYAQNVTGLTATTIPAVNEAGTSLGNVNVLQGTSPAVAPGTGDPYLYFLWYAGDGRGRYKQIDASRYHILTVEMGIPDMARDINLGSIARMVWQVKGEAPLENVSNDIIFNSRAGVNVMSKFITSMRTCDGTETEWNHCLRLETDPGASPSTTGWTGLVENFRFDAHEFTPATPFYVRRIKLAANERTVNNSYVIQWTYADALHAPGPSLTLYYDTDINPWNGMTQIAAGLNPAISNSYTWNTPGIPNGTYYIYAAFGDGVNANGVYSRWPIVVDSAYTGPLPRIVLNRKRLDFGGSDNGRIVSDPQTITVDVVGTDAAAVAWTVTTSDPAVVVTPSQGVGSGSVAVSIRNSTTYPDNLQGDYFITVSEATPGKTWNSPQSVRVFFQMHPKAATQAPFGAFDTPANGAAGLQGSFAVTGWALDDIGIERVEIWRDLVPGETTPPYVGSGPGNGKVFIARPLFISGSRTDVESAYPNFALSYRAGWGYLLLSWGLWQQGNGTYTLYAFAFDKEGHYTQLGTKTITVSNATATKPFGALDTPAYGQIVSGGFWNYGWALTPNASPPCSVTNGNVWMGIDSAALVPVNYGAFRADIAASFPGFSNGNNAGGATYTDTTSLTDGVHQIGWLVTDSCGRQDGIGSRFFTVRNGTRQDVAADSGSRPDPGGPGMAASSVRELSRDPIGVRRIGQNWLWSDPNASGLHVVEIPEGDRVEVQLPSLDTPHVVGAQVLAGARRPLPLGSSLDPVAGVFYWQPAAGFLGSYDLVFEADRGTGAMVRLRVVVGPPVRATIDAPSQGQKVQQPFVVAGWSVDLASGHETGIDAVHVWAYPVTGGKPLWLGEATLGGLRPDVAAVYGQEFANASYTLIATGLPAGTYDIVAYPHRAATGSFEGAQVVRIVVQ